MILDSDRCLAFANTSLMIEIKNKNTRNEDFYDKIKPAHL